MSEHLRGEEAIIQEFLAPLAAGHPGALGLLDDCAILTPTPGHDIVMKTDPVAAGVHFLADDAPEDIAWKALAANVSDLAAKAAVPRVYLMALSFPEAPTRAWMSRFAAGLGEAQRRFGMHLVGGDTDRRPGPMSVSITVLGEVPTGRMVRRAAACVGDLLYVTGTLGDAALGLHLQQEPQQAARWGLSESEAGYLLGRYRRPLPRLAMRQALRAHAGAAMDLSDGLAKDLGRMCKASGRARGTASLGAEVALDRLPLSPAFVRALAAEPDLIEAAVAGGDDYELLIAVPPDRQVAFEAAIEALAGLGETGVTGQPIGAITDSGEVALRHADGRRHVPRQTGWDHF